MIEELNPYSEYKESGLPWAPLVPAHWDLTPNRAVLRKRKVLVGENHKNFQLLSLTKAGVIVRDVSTGKGKFSSDIGTSQEVRKGDFVFCLFDVPETPRTIGLSTYDGMITSAYTVFESRNMAPERARYLERFYIAMDDRKLLSPLYSGLRNTIPPPRFLGIKTPQPPPDEQISILRFLDYANRKIDRFIRAKRKLVALLNEQKQTIIYLAVSRGLNSDVPLKPSGLPWVGNIPEHWDLLPNRAFLKLRKKLVGQRSTSYTLLSLSLRGVIARDMENPSGKFPAQFDTYQEVRLGDLVFCLFDIDETPRAIGLSRLEGMITGAYTVFETKNPDIAEYLYLFYLAMDEGKSLKPLYTGLRKTIPKAHFLGTKTPIPPPPEQAAILAHVRERTAPLNNTITRASREISLLQEYRTRLTADIVTGKLDVREAAAKLPALPQDSVGETLVDKELEEIEGEDVP